MVDDFVVWYNESFLLLNASKTKDMLINFRRTTLTFVFTTINGADVELVGSFKYLGVVLAIKLCFDSHVASVMKKVQQRLFFSEEGALV